MIEFLTPEQITAMQALADYVPDDSDPLAAYASDERRAKRLECILLVRRLLVGLDHYSGDTPELRDFVKAIFFGRLDELSKDL